jgi:hypothetical protein
MTIKQALKEKNRLAKEIHDLYAKAQQFNSIERGNTRKYEIAGLLDQARKLTNKLVELKTQIHLANAPVYHLIFALSELKNSVKELKMISTEEGKVTGRYAQTESFKEVEIDEVAKDRLVKELEVEIDGIQDQLDTHNAITEI